MIGIIISTFECNLSCQYCYEHSEANRVRTSRTTVNTTFANNLNMCKEYVSCLSELAKMHGRSTQIILHGGEPLMIMPDNLERLFERIRDNENVAIQIQTNGTLITRKIAEMLHRYDVGVVISVDGPQSIHDEYRKNAGRLNTFDMVIHAIDILRDKDVDVSALATITDVSSGRASDLFTFFSCLGIDFSVNRCFPVHGMSGGISEQLYRKFLSELFDLYYSVDLSHSRIRIPCFDRCIHDLKWNGNDYCYDSRISPYVSVFSIPEMKFELANRGQNKQFNSLSEYYSFLKLAINKETANSQIRLKGTLKDAVIEHLCRQQENDYLSALAAMGGSYEKSVYDTSV